VLVVFERFTDQARRMIMTAQEESRLLQHDYIGTEHILIAATEVDDGLTDALARLGITTEAVRRQATRMVAPAGVEYEGQIPLSPEATGALERSLREALQLGHGGIRPEHIVLGLLDVHDGAMPVLLTRVGVRADAVRTAVLAVLGPEPIPAPSAPAPAPACPGCGAPVAETIRLTAVPVDGEIVRLAYCGKCGAVIPVAFSP
jgi:ATP-dependent Clp protease ATP-binding subunit ClpC